MKRTKLTLQRVYGSEQFVGATDLFREFQTLSAVRASVLGAIGTMAYLAALGHAIADRLESGENWDIALRLDEFIPSREHSPKLQIPAGTHYWSPSTIAGQYKRESDHKFATYVVEGMLHGALKRVLGKVNQDPGFVKAVLDLQDAF
ncbi:MAG TPA: hypothetical protein VEY30_04270, partial [Myxococcaceae bacterium]|nr:hypothetical protein [Myxococcaceae bacterium]